MASCTTAASLPPDPSRKELIQCQFSSWYETFRNISGEERANVTIKSVVIRPLPPTFLEYLQSDGIRLPQGATQVSSCVSNEGENGDDGGDWSSNEDDENDSNDDSTPTTIQYSFPELNQAIQDAIQQLGGAIIPKLNWSSPKDATWINGGSLKCQTPGDVYLLLKSSDFVMHDLSLEMEEYELVLRKWCNLHPSMEFRCFVYNHELVAISQRQHTLHFPHLVRDRIILRSLILDFFDTVVEERFPLANYVFDVYIDKKERVWLLDLNVWGTQTDALLFDWNELANIGDVSMPELRVVETEREVHHDPLASYRAPIDTVELAAVAGNDRNKFEEFMSLCQRRSEVSDGDDDDEEKGDSA